MAIKVVVVVEQVVNVSSFIAKSRASKEALKSALLLKNLDVNVLIEGEAGVGKTFLAKIISDTIVIDGRNSKIEYIIDSISHNNVIIIKNFDYIKHLDLLETNIKKNKTRIIGLSNKELFEKVRDRFFSLKIKIPPLHERKEDIYPLAKKFLNDILQELNIDIDLDLKKIKLNIDKNCYSLKFSIYKAVIQKFLSEDDIMQFIQEFLETRIGTENDYRNNIYLYEIPLIKAGFEKYKSQLNISKQFGINRNTLRKKILEYNLQEK